RVREHRAVGVGRPVVARYERVCFEHAAVRGGEGAPAELITPGHPLLDAVVDLTLDDLGPVLQRGTVLYDADSDERSPRLLVSVTETVRDGHGTVVSRRLGYGETDLSGAVRSGGPAPYLDYGK